MEYTIELDKINNLPVINEGDIINIIDGIYNNINITLQYNGTQNKPITIKAKNYGKVIIQGNLSISIQGTFITFGNMIIKGVGLIRIGGHHNRLTNCDISMNSPSIFIDSVNSRVDHCYFHDFDKSGQWFEISRPTTEQNFLLVDHNIFKNRMQGQGNGFETVRLGTSTKSLSNSNSIIAYNTFENCDGEIEIISIKASDNIIYKNNFKKSYGSLTLRHGNNNLVVQNKFLQENEANAGGLRVAAGENHVLYNNLIKDANYGIRLDNGETSGIYNLPVKNTKIIKNVFINNNVDIIIGTSKFPISPVNSFFDVNLIYKLTNNPVFDIESSSSTSTYVNNKYYALNKGTVFNNEYTTSINDFNISSIDVNDYGYDENYIGVQSMININESEISVDIKSYFTYLKQRLLNEIDGQCFNDTIIVQPTWTIETTTTTTTTNLYVDEPLLPSDIPNISFKQTVKPTALAIIVMILFLLK